jgi:uncharacterized protein (DUF488 family)
MSELGELLDSIELDAPAPTSRDEAAIWVGSVGYEKHREVSAFAQTVAGAEVELLIDVRELPISRRRGFAKTALAAALADAGVDYLHLRSLGNPKEFRDLYKSGQVEAGRSAYERFLLEERREDLSGLAKILAERRCALMCVEDDPEVCHRQVILDALASPVGCGLEVERIG